MAEIDRRSFLTSVLGASAVTALPPVWAVEGLRSFSSMQELCEIIGAAFPGSTVRWSCFDFGYACGVAIFFPDGRSQGVRIYRDPEELLSRSAEQRADLAHYIVQSFEAWRDRSLVF